MSIFSGAGSSGGPGSGLPVGTVIGQHLVWNGTLWVPATVVHPFGQAAGQSIAALVNTFIGPGTAGAVTTTRANAGEFIYAGPTINVTTIRVYYANPSGGANPVTFTLERNQVATAKAVSLNTNVNGPASSSAGANPQFVSGDRWGIAVLWPTAVLIGLRASIGIEGVLA